MQAEALIYLGYSKGMNWGKIFFLLSALFVASLAACAQAPTLELQPRILYFTHRTDAESSLLAPGRLRAALGAQAVGEWGDLLVLHAARPAQAIIIDGAAAEAASADDLAAFYRQCVVLVFFNMYSPDVALLVKDPTVRSDGFVDGTEPYPDDFYIILHRVGRHEGQPECTGEIPVGEFDGLSKSRAQDALETPADFEVFLAVLRLELGSVP